MAGSDYLVNGSAITEDMIVINGTTKKGITWYNVGNMNPYNGITFTNAEGNIGGYALYKYVGGLNNPGGSAYPQYEIIFNNSSYYPLKNPTNNVPLKCYSDDQWGKFNCWDPDNRDFFLQHTSASVTDIYILFCNFNNELRYTKIKEWDSEGLPILDTDGLVASYKYDSNPNANGWLAFYLCAGGGGGGRGDYWNSGGSGGGGGGGASCFGYIEIFDGVQQYRNSSEVQTTFRNWLKGTIKRTDLITLALGRKGSGGTGTGGDGCDSSISYFLDRSTSPARKAHIQLGGGSGGERGNTNSSSNAKGGDGGIVDTCTYPDGPGTSDNSYIIFYPEHSSAGAAGGEGAKNSNTIKNPAGDLQPIIDYPQNGYSVDKFGGCPSTLYGVDLDAATRSAGGYSFFPAATGGKGGVGGYGGSFVIADGGDGQQGTFYVWRIDN